jgi:hypothetical protein
VNVYTSIVDARSWSGNIPDSILTARNYFKTVNPGTFFRTASPLNQLLALAALVASWKSGKKVRLYFGVALLLAALEPVLNFSREMSVLCKYNPAVRLGWRSNEKNIRAMLEMECGSFALRT